MNDTQKLYEEYGDKILISVIADKLPADADEAQQRKAAENYVERFCKAGKPSAVGLYSRETMLPYYREQLYISSRKKYSE